LIGPRSGLVLLDKPGGMSSFQAIGAVKRALGTGKVGHTGTLDRFATGLLPVLVGPATRLASLFLDLEKSYRAVFIFGISTETLDPEGEIVCRGEIPSLERIEQVLPGFMGNIEQLPPEYSAVHVDGQRAHKVKRQGRSPVLKARTVLIRRIIVHRYDPPELELSVECGKGTYMRALARDMARAAGSCAYVSSLRRTRVGSFRIEEAVCPEDFDVDRDVHPPAWFLAEIPGLRCITLENRFREQVLSGRPFQGSWSDTSEAEDGLLAEDGVLAALGEDGALLAILVRRAGAVAYRAVFPEARA
jgi:tRNA pseudouridine55 synthase